MPARAVEAAVNAARAATANIRFLRLCPLMPVSPIRVGDVVQFARSRSSECLCSEESTSLQRRLLVFVPEFVKFDRRNAALSRIGLRKPVSCLPQLSTHLPVQPILNQAMTRETPAQFPCLRGLPARHSIVGEAPIMVFVTLPETVGHRFADLF